MVALENLDRRTLLEPLSPRDIIMSGEKVKRHERIPLDSAITENALIDNLHADKLADSMSQERGQISPIAVRARIGEKNEEVVYDIIDGFHRAEGMKRQGGIEINATVVYGCSDEELYDLRMLAVSSVRSVQFARTAEWITKSWDTTYWSKKGLSVSQAFAIVVNDTQIPQDADLTPQETSELKEWVKTKTQRWGKSISSTYGILRVVAISDPELVKRVRIQDKKGAITPQKLRKIAGRFSGPGEENLKAQRAIARVIVDRRLYARETETLLNKAEKLIKPGMTEDKIYKVTNEIPIERALFQGSEGTISETIDTKEEFEGDDGTSDHKPTDEELHAIEEDLGSKGNKPHLHVAGRGFSMKKTVPVEDDPKILREKIRYLKEALREANKHITPSELWWRTLEDLEPIERVVMERVMYANESLWAVAEEYHVTPVVLLKYIQSAFAKRQDKKVSHDFEALLQGQKHYWISS